VRGGMGNDFQPSGYRLLRSLPVLLALRYWNDLLEIVHPHGANGRYRDR
jgi:hypothetical protein